MMADWCSYDSYLEYGVDFEGKNQYYENMVAFDKNQVATK